MKSMIWHFRRKSAWGDGPWQDEPDKGQWLDEATGLPCLILRGPKGALCAYVGVSEGHPWFGRDHSDIDVNFSRPLTFSAFCADDELGICHKVEEGENDRVWWLGFACDELDEYCPDNQWRAAVPMQWKLPDQRYVTWKEVKEDVKRLAIIAKARS